MVKKNMMLVPNSIKSKRCKLVTWVVPYERHFDGSDPSRKKIIAKTGIVSLYLETNLHNDKHEIIRLNLFREVLIWE